MKSNQQDQPFQNWIRGASVLVWICLLAAWTALLLIPVPSEAVSAVGGAQASFWVSKFLHVSVYAVFALLIAWLPLARRWRIVLIVLLVMHGGTTEIAQQFVHRGSSWLDFGRDSLGIALGILLGWRRWRGNALAKSPEE